MSISVDTINLRFNIKPDYDQQKLQQLQEDLQQGQKELENTRKAMDRLSKNGLKAMTKEQREEFDRLSDHLSKTAREVHENEQKMKQFTRTSDISKMSIHQLGQRAKELSAVIKNMNPRTDDFKEYKKELDAVNNRMKELRSTADNTKAALTKFVDGFNKFAWSIQFAYQGAQKVVQWADQYVQSFAKMDEAMTDVTKYTGQTKREVEEMNETFKQMTTRTAREELNALAGAAGRLGITARKDIEGFDYETGTGVGGTQTLAVSFMTYGRAMEIAGRKRRKRIKAENANVWGKKNRSRTGKKVEWYNRNRYAGYGRLIRRLTAGMSEQELQRIRGILNQARRYFAQSV